MKSTVKVLALILSALMLSVCFVSCSKEEADPIVFGTNAEFAPFEFVTSGQGLIDQFDGIDIAMADMIAKDLGTTAKIENMEFESLIIALSNGMVDAVIAGMTVNAERLEEVDFSIPYYAATQVMIVKEDSDIQKASDMTGKKIAVIQGYTGELAVQDLGYKVNEDYISFKKGSEAILELVNGKCDVVVLDSATSQKYVSDNPGLKIVTDPDVFEGEEYAIAVKKGNTELLEKINKCVQKMLDDGTIAELSAKYIDEE